ncbi:cytochrome P450 family protein [Poronia punctata]|nr:cytochrome P450 family protein [Poronia punctata]
MLSLNHLAAILTLAVCCYVVYQCYFSPLAVFPGPVAAKLTKAWRARLLYNGYWHRDLPELHKRYGPVVRIGPDELSIGDPEAFRTIYRVNNAFTKPHSHALLKGTRSFDLVNEQDEKLHGIQRRLVARPYSMESMRRLEPHMDELLDMMLRRFDEAAMSRQAIDLGYWIQLFAFDVIGAVSFGRHFGFVASGTDRGIFARLERALNSSAWVVHVRWFFWLHQEVIMPLFGNFLAINDRNGFFHAFAEEQVKRRRIEGGEKDIVGQLFQLQKGKTEITDTVIGFMMTSNVFAGSDTTSATLRAVFLSLLKAPRTMAKLRHELESCRSIDRTGGRFSFEEAESCHYLQAVIYEAMRLYPAVPGNLERNVPSEGMTICGKFVPGGTVVGSSAWVIHQMQEVWGDDAAEFRPERWLDNDRVGELRRFFFGFGGGTRTCIGRSQCLSSPSLESALFFLLSSFSFPNIQKHPVCFCGVEKV